MSMYEDNQSDGGRTFEILRWSGTAFRVVKTINHVPASKGPDTMIADFIETTENLKEGETILVRYHNRGGISVYTVKSETQFSWRSATYDTFPRGV